MRKTRKNKRLRQKAAPAPPADAKPAPQPRGSDRRRAIKLFLEASKLFEKEQFEAAMEGYRKAASLDPENRDYPAAAEVARSHAVTALIQAANKARMKGDKAAERAALARALDLDGKNPEVAEHLRELGDDELRGMEKPLYDQSSSDAGEPEKLEPTPGTHSFHLRTDQRNILLQVYKAWGFRLRWTTACAPRRRASTSTTPASPRPCASWPDHRFVFTWRWTRIARWWLAILREPASVHAAGARDRVSAWPRRPPSSLKWATWRRIFLRRSRRWWSNRRAR